MTSDGTDFGPSNEVAKTVPPTVAVAIPSIPHRAPMLARALASVTRQTRLPDEIAVAIDHDFAGAAAARNRAWRMTTTKWVAFLDDDDEFGCAHIAKLLALGEAEDADLVFPWFEVVGGWDPFPQHFAKPWDPSNPRQTTITCLWRRDALERVGGFPGPTEGTVDELGNRAGEDFGAVCALNDLGGRIVHLPERTWMWHHHGANTSGRPDLARTLA